MARENRKLGKLARVAAGILLAAMGLASAPAAAQVQTEIPPVVAGAKPVVIERIKVHSAALEGNLEGNSADRDVLVVLPPSYRANPGRRYPVVYALHGYFIGAEQWIQEIHVPQVVEGAFGNGVPEMIVVLPDSKTVHLGSVYSTSVTTGDFENFIARDLVAYVDQHYRTIPRRESRGLAGHSMGGYGTTRIGMRHADVFGALYIMSPGGLGGRPIGTPDPAVIATISGLSSPADPSSVPTMQRGLLAMSSAWSPNPNKPPLYFDLPYDADGKPNDSVLARWTANSPFAMLDQYVPNLRRYAAIAIDVGDRDGLKSDSERLHARLLEYGIANSFEVYSGDHTSAVAFRFQDHVLPFFGEHLSFEVPPPPTSAEVPGDRGSGPYPAVMEVDPSLPRHVVYRPENLAGLSGKKMPIYIWGNGACTDDGASVRNHLLEIASHGYLVIAPGFVGDELVRAQASRPAPAPGALTVPTTTKDLRDGLDWALAQNTLAGSRYRGVLDTNAVAASGFSCGGVQAIELATSDPRVKALIVQNSGLFPEGAARIPGMDLAKAALANLRTPVLYIQGGPTDIAWDNGYDDYTRINHVPIALVGLPVGHGGTYHDPHGGAVAAIALDWLEWQLRGSDEASRSFLGENCRLCTVPGWTIERKGF